MPAATARRRSPMTAPPSRPAPPPPTTWAAPTAPRAGTPAAHRDPPCSTSTIRLWPVPAETPASTSHSLALWRPDRGCTAGGVRGGSAHGSTWGGEVYSLGGRGLRGGARAWEGDGRRG